MTSSIVFVRAGIGMAAVKDRTRMTRALKTIVSGFLCSALIAGGAHAGEAKLVKEIKGPDGYWDAANYDPVHRRVLIAREDGAMSLDVASERIGHVAPGTHTHAVVPLPDGRLLLTNGHLDQVAIVDAAGMVVAKIPVGHDPDMAVFDPASRMVFVMNRGSGDVSAIDTAQGREVGRTKVGGELEAGAVDGHGGLFVNVADKAQVAVLDTKTLAVRARFALRDCKDPSAIAYVGDAGAIVSTCGDGHVAVSGAADGRSLGAFDINPHPDAAIYDPERKRLFIASAGSVFKNGEILVLKVSPAGQFTVDERIGTARGARTMAQDPRTGRLYLPTATYALGLNGQPHPQPGTFRVLVVQP
jgi:DNA-binding beta-propeller fold protein YncE